MHVPGQLIPPGKLVTVPPPTTPTDRVASLPPPGQSKLLGSSTVIVAYPTADDPPDPLGRLAEIVPPPQPRVGSGETSPACMLTTLSSTFHVTCLVMSV